AAGKFGEVARDGGIERDPALVEQDHYCGGRSDHLGKGGQIIYGGSRAYFWTRFVPGESAEAALEDGLALSPDDYGCTAVSTCFDPSFDYAVNGFEPFGGHADRGWGGYWQANATGRIGGGWDGGDRAGSSGEGKKKSSSQHQKDLQHEDRQVRTERGEAQFVIFDDSGNP